ncbi:MAG: ATP-dependent helicase [Anaerolineales bacterium]|nr:ATP-dependent helicase [Anaerolineales bacterium]
MMLHKARVSQEQAINYSGGRLGIAAVPGSGKTWTLSRLAAKLIGDGKIQTDQRVLIVTFANSSVENFSRQINLMIKDAGFLPGYGYRVRTLHGVAHDIVRERPGLVGVSEDFQIIDDRASQAIIESLVERWLRDNPLALDSYLAEVAPDRIGNIRSEQMPTLLLSLAKDGIAYAKDSQIAPEQIENGLQGTTGTYQLATMIWQIYSEYQKALAYRGALDFSDLIHFARKALDADGDYLERLRYRWPYVLEDEAQDSSALQEAVLAKLVGPNGNWVRVGDPNQAIYETFTTANPNFLRNFISTASSVELSVSGRSSQPVIDLANYLIAWTQEEHPNLAARDALSAPLIQPAPEGDPQGNPSAKESSIFIPNETFSDAEELEFIAASCREWVDDSQQQTAVILVPFNDRGFDLVKALQRKGIEPIDTLLKSSIETRKSAGGIVVVLRYLSKPYDPQRLADVLKVYQKHIAATEISQESLEILMNYVRGLSNLENLVWPVDQQEFEDSLRDSGLASERIRLLTSFIAVVRRWLMLRLFSVDQIILSLASEIYKQPEKIALCHKFALLLKGIARENPEWGLNELAEELTLIAKNKRKFLGMSPDEIGFDPDQHKGRIAISTVHSAKGLEWDRVYLVSANNYNFPSGMDGDSFYAEKWFIRGRLNLMAEAKAQLGAVASGQEYYEGQATYQARDDYVKERLRLLYVGLTRAKRELIITWSKGRWGNSTPAIALTALQKYNQEKNHASSEI